MTMTMRPTLLRQIRSLSPSATLVIYHSIAAHWHRCSRRSRRHRRHRHQTRTTTATTTK